jgi:hypothetical protein
MKEFTSFEISENTFKKINESKDSMGFAKKSWDDWFNSLLSISNDDKSDKNTIEQIIRKNASNSWYKQWVRNFAINLPHIWKDPSAIELAKTRNSDSSALVIGRGPSIVKHNHLELLAKSDFKGAIICADGNLLNVLEAGITPDKFNLFVVTIDAQENQKKCYEHELIKKFGNGIKCIFSTTAHPQAYLAAKNAGLQVYWIHTLFDFEEGKKSFNQIQGIMSRAQNNEKKIPAIQTGANVGTSSWVIGWSILKCNHIGLIGLDLGYDDSTPWDKISYHGYPIPTDIDKNSEIFKRAYPTIYNSEFDCNCKQDPLFLYYCNALKEFIQKTQNKVKTINATEGGALFGEGVHCTSLKNFVDNYNFSL